MPWLSPSSSPCRDIRLIEVTENICKRLLDYNLHKERSGSNRFAKVRAVPPVPAPHPHGACLTHPFTARVTIQVHSHPLDPLLVPGMQGHTASQVRCGVLSMVAVGRLPLAWREPGAVILLGLGPGLQRGTHCHLNFPLVILTPQGLACTFLHGWAGLCG